MNPMILLKISQSRFVRVLDFLLPVAALAVAAFYFWGKHDNTQAIIWLVTALVGFCFTIANISKLMLKMLTKGVAKRG